MQSQSFCFLQLLSANVHFPDLSVRLRLQNLICGLQVPELFADVDQPSSDRSEPFPPPLWVLCVSNLRIFRKKNRTEKKLLQNGQSYRKEHFFLLARFHVNGGGKCSASSMLFFRGVSNKKQQLGLLPPPCLSKFILVELIWKHHWVH